MEQPVCRSSYILYGEAYQKPARGTQLKTLHGKTIRYEGRHLSCHPHRIHRNCFSCLLRRGFEWAVIWHMHDFINPLIEYEIQSDAIQFEAIKVLPFWNDALPEHRMHLVKRFFVENSTTKEPFYAFWVCETMYSEVSVIAINGDRDHPRKLKIHEVAAPLKKCLKTYIGIQDTPCIQYTI